MVAVDTALVQILDVGLLLCGGVCVIGWMAKTFQHGRWREPLAGAPGNEFFLGTGAVPMDIGALTAARYPRTGSMSVLAGPTWSAILGYVVAYLCLFYLGASLALWGTSRDAAQTPGSSAWHRVQLAESAARLVTGGLLAVAYLHYAAALRRRPISLPAGAAVACVATLMTIALTTPQLQMGRVVWEWLNPGEPLPSHMVLKALQQSAWGFWGTVQLAISAVLLAPFSEELLFRGLLLDGLRRDLGRVWPAILLSAFGFAGVHAQPQDILPLVTMGIVLGYLRVRTGHLWPCVLAHMLFNGRTIALTLLSLGSAGGPG